MLAELNEAKRQTRAYERGWKQVRPAEIWRAALVSALRRVEGKLIVTRSPNSQAMLDAKDLESLTLPQTQWWRFESTCYCTRC